MGLTKYLKGTAAVLTVAALALALSGCGGGGKKEAKKFSVPADKLPEGVISVIKPRPNNETRFVRSLVFEAIRRNHMARLYTDALIHFDPKKGTAADYERLVKKMKAAWKSARDSASVATFYALGLSQLERTEGYNPYQKKTAMLTVAEIHLMPTAYAKEDKKKLPASLEGKKLMSISQALRLSGTKACDIADMIKPKYDNAEFYDAAYKAANVAKTAGKVAGLVIAGATAATAAPVGIAILGAAAFTTNIIDTGLDFVQTSVVVLKGDEDEDLQKVQAYSGTANFALNLLSGAASWTHEKVMPAFLKAKTVAGNKGFVKGSTVFVKKLAKDSARPYIEGGENLFNRSSTWEDADSVTQIPDFYVDLLEMPENSEEIAGDVKSLWNSMKTKDTVVVTARKTEDGSTETRVGSLSLKNGTDKDKASAEALGLLDGSATMDSLKKQSLDGKQEKAKSATATSTELEKAAEEVANAGGANKYAETFNTFVDTTLKGLVESVIGPGGNIRDLDKVLSEAVGEEMKATGIMVSTDNNGNITKVTVVGEKKNAEAPFAPSKVAGSYKVYVPKEKTTAYVTVRPNGGTISVSYYYYWEVTNSKGEVTKREKESEGPFTPSYDPQTGRGTAGEYTFWFTNNGGQMSLTVR